MILADSAEAAGAVVGRIIGLALGVVALVVGIRMVSRKPPPTGGRRVWGIVLIVLGGLLLLGSLAALSVGTATGGT